MVLILIGRFWIYGVASDRRKLGKRGKQPGAKLYTCKKSVDVMELEMGDFVDGVIDIVTAGDFMDMTDGAQIVFI